MKHIVLDLPAASWDLVEEFGEARYINTHIPCKQQRVCLLFIAILVQICIGSLDSDQVIGKPSRMIPKHILVLK